MTLSLVHLRRREERRVLAGHPWIFSNEIDVAKSPLAGFAPGELVHVQSSSKRSLGVGYINPQCLICVRMLSARDDARLDAVFLERRIARALALRERVFEHPYYRLIFGESDGLPGLVVDRFADVLVAQLNTAGMQMASDEVINALTSVLKPRAIVLRNDSHAREREGLERRVDVALGQVPETLNIEENGVQFQISPGAGQKTGWYFDHRRNRLRLKAYAAGARVLDLFSYVGGFGVQAAQFGAREVLCVDSSADAIEGVMRNASLNTHGERVQAECGDAFEVLKRLASAKAKFDVVIVDPPAFARRKKDLKNAAEAYRRLNRLAFAVLEDDGMLMSASCSSHLSGADFVELLGGAARAVGVGAQIIERGGQGPDHPVHPALAESNYLKFAVARRLVLD